MGISEALTELRIIFDIPKFQDARSSGLAILGVYVARANNEAERLALVEAIQFNDLNGLVRRYVQQGRVAL
jgi:hypothetical protein